jgi:hypothetical protein
MENDDLINQMRRELNADFTGKRLEAFIRSEKPKGLSREQALECLTFLLRELNQVEPETGATQQMTDSVHDIIGYVMASVSNPDFWTYPRESE